jgi:hypothetical protein
VETEFSGEVHVAERLGGEEGWWSLVCGEEALEFWCAESSGGLWGEPGADWYMGMGIVV